MNKADEIFLCEGDIFAPLIAGLSSDNSAIRSAAVHHAFRSMDRAAATGTTYGASIVQSLCDIVVTHMYVESDSQVSIDSGVVSALTIDGKEVSLDLPNKELESLGLDEYSTSPSGASIAVTNEGGGAFRSLIHIPNLESNGEFEFSFSNDMTLSSLPDGGVTVRDNKGDILGTLDAPWAIDATGASVKTWYEIRQSTIVQHVAPTSSTQFPVVADPFWIPFLGIMGGHLTRHALTQMAKRKITKELVEHVIKTGRGSKGNGNTTVFNGNGIRVIVDNVSGNVITVTKG
ncbi:hypothetical protein YH66_07110 [[Brevibacterium] flavum]|uniref:DUF4258 domain-containing protein n=2 Tax=Corynebacterium TaxID=1716 RepID=A0A0F6Z6B7_9CORY|nr:MULTISPECIES: DUF4258 domain-containing protein [Corynebacterium]AKF27333.1 hypothetical protein YH66_07110 [[Brevibacterium] flavum]ANE08158.1 hypothetical protein A3654_07135 [Corynebacterium glutamicum]AST20580.1 DUF4258 domain-containing protein [Corynebacterium glutamicum ATCC 14067]KEI23070.1 hypothetical protein KIQ_010985 [Corynebacterium glutamicum ATCC 14067]KIH73739.1 hypothetical protein SD36_07160 [Corynebacterium glutamicum]